MWCTLQVLVRSRLSHRCLLRNLPLTLKYSCDVAEPDVYGTFETLAWLHHSLGYRVADWFAQLNNKMGGDLKKIKVVGEYMIEVWKAVGMNLDMVEFLWASDAINERPHEYWSLVMDISIKFKLNRIMRCTQIMGRDDSDLQASQIFYPCMQCADIFYLKVLLCSPCHLPLAVCLSSSA